MQVWGNLVKLCDWENLISLFAVLPAVKVFLNDAVGIIGKLARGSLDCFSSLTTRFVIFEEEWELARCTNYGRFEVPLSKPFHRFLILQKEFAVSN